MSPSALVVVFVSVYVFCVDRGEQEEPTPRLTCVPDSYIRSTF